MGTLLNPMHWILHVHALGSKVFNYWKFFIDLKASLPTPPIWASSVFTKSLVLLNYSPILTHEHERVHDTHWETTSTNQKEYFFLPTLLEIMWPKNIVKHFLWMKAGNPNSALWQSCQRHGVSKTSKKFMLLFFCFWLGLLFRRLLWNVLVCWFQWWSMILAVQWILFMNSVNCGSKRGLVRSFKGSERRWRKISYMR